MTYLRRVGLGFCAALFVTNQLTPMAYAEEYVESVEVVESESSEELGGAVIESEENLDAVFMENQMNLELGLQESGFTLQQDPGALEFHDMLKDHFIIGAVNLCDSYDVKAGPSYESAVISTVPCGQTIQILYEQTDDQDQSWVLVKFFANDEELTGYIEREYIACADELFLEWERTYRDYSPEAVMDFPMTYSVNGNYETEIIENNYYPDILQFPESYQAALLKLKKAHPNWTFVKQETGLDWSAVMAGETVKDRNLIPKNYPEYMSAGAFDNSWKNANYETVSYYLDPRSNLTEDWIFQFEQLTYNASYHTEASIQTFLDSTFMKGVVPDDGRTYAKVFWEIGTSIGVSPFHLASRVYQEQGKGTSPLISGTYSGYEGYYNYFNVKASGKTNEAVYQSGLQYAKEQGWNTRYKSLKGGAAFISKQYILAGQDTLYLQKFDVDGSTNGLYYHQYMQNIVAPQSESTTIRKQYINTGSLNNTFVFKIPVYKNMPSKACEKPNGNMVKIQRPSGYTTNEITIDGVTHEANMLGNTMTVYLNNPTSTAAVVNQYNADGVPIGMTIYTLTYNASGNYTATLESGLTNLLSYHGFSIRVSGNSGIRVKMGIDQNQRAQLTSGSGINGYRLKKYGILVMYRYNLEKYPMICGGAKVKESVAFDVTNGTDKYFEKVNGRYRYTMVFTGLPVSEYKKDFAFRSYIVLSKNGQDIIVYGPIVSNSIYTLAHRMIDEKRVKPGDSEYEYVQALIKDADAYEQGH